jgi:hypothetical protein
MRRKFLMAAVLGSGAAASGLTLSVLTAARAWAEASSSASTGPALAKMARLMCPHDVPESVYVEVMDSILSAALSDPGLDRKMDQALSALDAATGGDFVTSGSNIQLEAMQASATQTWFAAIQGQVLPRIYNHPVIWKHIGYPGSSVEYGGYKDRGFNDIDWLPADSS